MILIGLALYFVVLTTRPDPLPEAWQTTAGTALSTTASAALAEWRHGGASALKTYLRVNGERTGAQFWMFDGHERELSGLAMPPSPTQSPYSGDPDNPPPPQPKEQTDLEQPQPIPPAGGELHNLPRQQQPPGSDTEPPSAFRLQRVSRRARESAQPIFETAGPMVIAASLVRDASNNVDNGAYVLVAVMPRPRFGRPAAEPRVQLMGGLVVLGLSGLVCYGLVLYLTKPLVALRAATRRLANGDLGARTYAAQTARRDEVADLGRDFDSMAERIESLVRSQHRLLGDISHELRSPLSRLGMALALARRHAAQGNTLAKGNVPEVSVEMQTALDRIGRESARLNALIGQLLELARLESGVDNDNVPETGIGGASGHGDMDSTIAKRRDMVDLAQLVREIGADAEFEAKSLERGVQVQADTPCRLCGARNLLHSAIENVVRNAIRHTNEGTTIEITLLHQSDMACIIVRDHGRGVPDASLSQIFRPFYRVEDARDRASGGAGLGLAITERAITAHGGTVRALNAPGGGLQVELCLPLAQ